MQYQLIGTTMPAVEIQLCRDETMYTQSGGMAWMTEGIDMQTNVKGGIRRGLGRVFSGESLFMASYTATAEQATIAFASTVAGEILPVKLDGTPGLICQKGAFLCAQDSVELRAVFTKKLTSGLFGGEGFVLQSISGHGTAFLEIDGDRVEKELGYGETILVDTGNVVAFSPSVDYDVQTVKGITNIFLGGEGLFLTRLTGPGKVILQTQNFAEFAGRIASRIPANT